ncbi:hypothetical protein OOT08_09790, partial [Leucobacter sp. M11]
MTIVRDHDDSPSGSRKAADEPADRVEVAGVDASAGFVEDDDRAIAEAGDGDRETLLLAARQGQGVPLCEVFQVKLREEVRNARSIGRPPCREVKFAPDRVREELALNFLGDEHASAAASP